MITNCDLKYIAVSRFLQLEDRLRWDFGSGSHFNRKISAVYALASGGLRPTDPHPSLLPIRGCVLC